MSPPVFTGSRAALIPALASWAASVEVLSGWTVAALDVANDAVRLTLRRLDRVLVVDRDSAGRCVVEMSAVDHAEASVGRRGDRTRVNRVTQRLLWREKPPGLRAALRIAGDRIGSRDALRPVVNTLALPAIVRANLDGMQLEEITDAA